jgi:hypothetical protein
MEEGGRIQRTGTTIKDVVVIGLRTREDFYGQSFWVRDPLEWPRTGAGSLRWRVRRLGISFLEEDEPKALENERKRTSMQGNNILGEKKKETKALFYSGLGH